MTFATVIVALAMQVTGTQSIDQTIRARFGPAHDDTAVCISHAEDPSRRVAEVSPTHDHGLFQIHVDPWASGRWIGTGKWKRYFTVAQLHTVSGNIRAALILSSHGANFDPWTGTYVALGVCHGLS